MTELGTTGAGELQIAEVPRVHRSLERGTTGDDLSHGQTRVGFPWNLPTDTTSKDPRQYGGERLFPHWTKSWLGLRPACWTPAKAKSKKPSHVGRWRQPKEAVEPRAAVEEDRTCEHGPQRDVMPTAIPRAGALQGGVPLHQRQPGAYSARGMEALEANAVSDDELETEYQEAMALLTLAKQRRAWKPQFSSRPPKLSLTSSSRNFHVYNGETWAIGEDGHHCRAGGSSK